MYRKEVNVVRFLKMLVLLLVPYKEKGVAIISQLLDFESGPNRA